MRKPNDKHEPEDRATPSSRRSWTRPELVEYGHLAKLTRGASGTFIDTGGMMKTMCL